MKRFLQSYGLLLFVVAGCRDDPLFVPASEKSTDAAGEAGETNAGGQGGEGGTTPYGYGAQAAASYGAWSGVELPPVQIAGTSSQGGSAGSGGAGGSGPVVNKNCGDSKIDAGEECDDGNKLSGDGCSSNCLSRCETCEKNECINWLEDDNYTICYNIEGQAQQGPAVGVDRKVLCHDLVDCVRETGCAQNLSDYLDFKRCWCDLDLSLGTSACESDATYVAGKCAREFEEAAETSNKKELLASLTKTTIAVGSAYRLLRDCDQIACREECVGDYFDSAEVCTITADIPSAIDATSGESPLGSVIADAYRSAGGTQAALVWSSTYLFGGYSSPGLLFAATPGREADAEGRVLPSELWVIFQGYRPLDNQNGNRPQSLVTLGLTGQQIYDALNSSSVSSTRIQVSGLDYVWSPILPSGEQVVDVRHDGTAIEKSQVYTVTMDNVLASRGFLAGIMPRTVLPNSLPSEVLITYLKTQGQPVAPPTPGRIVKAP